MNSIRSMRWLTMALAAVAFVGCGGSGTGPSSAASKDGPAAAASPAQPAAQAGRIPAGAPQPKLPQLKLWLGPHELAAEIARTAGQMSMGMMFRTNMSDGEAMLFVQSYQGRASFWMKNTLIALSCAYIDSEGKIRELHDMKPLDESPIAASTDEIQYVLETPQGWFSRHQVGTGMVVRTERGSLSETFFKR